VSVANKRAFDLGADVECEKDKIAVRGERSLEK
jgi:hypothetical protein